MSASLALDRLTDLTDLTPLSETTNCPDPAAAYRLLDQAWGPVAPVELDPGIPAWLVMRERDIRAVARNDVRFSRDPEHWRLFTEGAITPDSPLAPILWPRENAFYRDGDEHRRLREPLEAGLAGLSEQRVVRIMREICTRLIDRLPAASTIDLVPFYTAQVPMLAVAALFGFDPDLSDQLMTCMIALFGVGADAPERSHELNDILTQIIAQRRAAPADDLTTVFLNHPKFTGEDEIHSSMVLTMSAGWETMQVWIANALKIMLTDARFNAQMRGGRLGVDDALAEVLLREPPMANMPIRYATEDTVLGGRRIARGDALIFAIAAAHGNPQTGPRHNSIDTSNGGHLAWGVGPHACPARRVSGIIAHTAIDTFLHRLPQTRLAIPGNDIPLHPSPWTRGPAQLPVTTTRTPVPEADHHA